MTTFAMSAPEIWGSWLSTAEDLRRHAPEPVEFFAAIEVDARGAEPFRPLISRLKELGGAWWLFSLDDGRSEVTTKNRLLHLTMGQNLCSQRADAVGASHMLFMAADCQPPADAIGKLLEVGWPLVGGEVPTYCLAGPEVEGYGFPVQAHMPTAAFVLIAREVFTRLRWRQDRDLDMSDDPAYNYDAETLLGYPGRVRKDCVGHHFPESIPAVELRGFDMRVVR